MAADVVAAERARAFDLLALGEFDTEWREEAAVPDAQSLGALDGFRLVSAGDQVRLSVYVYSRWGEGLDTGITLEEMVDGDVYYARSTTNGRLLCFALCNADSSSGRQLVDEVLGAMAGWE